MMVYGRETLEMLLRTGNAALKMVANETAVYLFSESIEHRDAIQPGLRYEDDSAGNALAGMLRPGRIEFRHHRGFADERVRQLAQRILRHPDLPSLSGFTVTYQGRVIIEETRAS